MPELTVAILAVPRLITLDLSIPLHVLGAASFRSAFRREVGTTPSDYRKSTGHADRTSRDRGTSQVDEA